MKYHRMSLFVSALLAVILAACATAPAPVDGEVERLLANTTMWVIDKIKGPIPPAAATVLYDRVRQLGVLGTSFQEGFAFTVLDMKTMESLDDPEVVKQLTGNYVNWKTWGEFKHYLIYELGFVEQVLVMWATNAGSVISHSWYTFVIGFSTMPSELTLPGVEVPEMFYLLPGLPAEGYAVMDQ